MSEQPTPAQRVQPCDSFTIYNAAALKHQLLEAVAGATAIELDLSLIGEMDTAGIQLLVLAKREAQRRGGTLRIVAHSPAVREVLELYNMLPFFGDPLVIPATERA